MNWCECLFAEFVEWIWFDGLLIFVHIFFHSLQHFLVGSFWIFIVHRAEKLLEKRDLFHEGRQTLRWDQLLRSVAGMQFAAPKWIQVSFPRKFQVASFHKATRLTQLPRTLAGSFPRMMISNMNLLFLTILTILESVSRLICWPKIKMPSPMESFGWHILSLDDSLFAVSTSMNFRNDKTGRNKTPKTSKNVFSMVLQISFQVCVSGKYYCRDPVSTSMGEKVKHFFPVVPSKRSPRFFGAERFLSITPKRLQRQQHAASRPKPSYQHSQQNITDGLKRKPDRLPDIMLQGL